MANLSRVALVNAQSDVKDSESCGRRQKQVVTRKAFLVVRIHPFPPNTATQARITALMGNSDLRPQKTVKGEIGLQQQLGESTAIDITMFFEDFRDLADISQQTDIQMKGGIFSR